MSLFDQSSFIVSTYDALSSVIAAAGPYGWFSGVQTVIIDDAHSQLELETLITLTDLQPSQLLLIGCEELPGPLCHSYDNCKITHYNKSLFTRMLEREFISITVKH